MTPEPVTQGDLPPPILGWSQSAFIGATSEEVSRALTGLRGNLIRLGLPEEALIRLELVLAEIMNNIVEHAYAGADSGDMMLEASVHGRAIWCHLRDKGRAMPGGKLPCPRRYDLDAMRMDDLPEGGFGWGLIHDLTQGLSYRRFAEENHVRFRIDLDS